jgi:thymidylate kinase
LPVLWYKFRRHFGGKQSNKMLQSGGAIIAFVGADASGKSTLVMETGRWLGKVLAVRTVHVGKPPSAWLTMPVNLALRLARRLFPHLHRRRQKTPERTDNANTFRHPGEDTLSLVAALRAVTLALDRRNLIVKSRRRAAHGEIVICDRYPAEVIGAMDSPRLREQITGEGRRAALYNWLARVERRLYDQIPPPDIVLKLSVSIATMKNRNRERAKTAKDAEDYLEVRHQQSGEWRKSGTKYLHDIDADHSLAETILRVQKAIWQSL